MRCPTPVRLSSTITRSPDSAQVNSVGALVGAPDGCRVGELDGEGVDGEGVDGEDVDGEDVDGESVVGTAEGDL